MNPYLNDGPLRAATAKAWEEWTRRLHVVVDDQIRSTVDSELKRAGVYDLLQTSRPAPPTPVYPPSAAASLFASPSAPASAFASPPPAPAFTPTKLSPSQSLASSPAGGDDKFNQELRALFSSEGKGSRPSKKSRSSSASKPATDAKQRVRITIPSSSRMLLLNPISEADAKTLRFVIDARAVEKMTDVPRVHTFPHTLDYCATADDLQGLILQHCPLGEFGNFANVRAINADFKDSRIVAVTRVLLGLQMTATKKSMQIMLISFTSMEDLAAKCMGNTRPVVVQPIFTVECDDIGQKQLSLLASDCNLKNDNLLIFKPRVREFKLMHSASKATAFPFESAVRIRENCPWGVGNEMRTFVFTHEVTRGFKVTDMSYLRLVELVGRRLEPEDRPAVIIWVPSPDVIPVEEYPIVTEAEMAAVDVTTSVPIGEPHAYGNDDMSDEDDEVVELGRAGEIATNAIVGAAARDRKEERKELERKEEPRGTKRKSDFHVDLDLDE